LPWNAQARARLEVAYQRMLEAANDVDQSRVVETHLDFHLAVAESGGNEMLVENLEPLQIQTRRLIMYTEVWSAGRPDEHRTIIGPDADAAEQIVREHIRRSGELVLKHLTDLRPRWEA
jgi:DNA-binding GntR family transcriptional regulator